MDDRGVRREVVSAGEPESPPGRRVPIPASGLAPRLQFIPLPVRMVLYTLAFLSFILGLLPYLAYQLDVYVPRWHVEIGPLRFVGWLMLAGFLGMYLWCSYLLSRLSGGAFVEFDPPQGFVATGPFLWSRNPIAGCVVAMLLSEAIAFSSTGIFLLFLVSMPLAHLQVTRLEEPLLQKRFGDAYEAYLREVPRWLPRRPSGSGL